MARGLGTRGWHASLAHGLGGPHRFCLSGLWVLWAADTVHEGRLILGAEIVARRGVIAGGFDFAP